MTATDPLALRHGALISKVWAIIGKARTVARSAPDQAQCTYQLKRMRHMRRYVLAARQAELEMKAFEAAEVKAWFRPVENSLEKAEAYFAGVIRSQHPQHPAVQHYRQARSQIRA